jgi:thiol-disulfide isomerase/thioredoxin/outer membrane lipoprotein-sorting protein
MRLAILAALTLSLLCAQQLPDGETLTKQAEEALKRIHSLQYKEDMITETTFSGETMKDKVEISRAVVNPGKMRMESKTGGLTTLTVSDGESTWLYNSSSNEYVRKSAVLGPEGMMDAMGMSDFAPKIADMRLTQKTTGEESLTIDGQKHDCWVVHTDIGAMQLPAAARGAKMEDATMTAWIDKKLGIDLQSETSMKVSMPGGVSTRMHVKMVKKDLAIDAPIADSIFAFTPPAGAKEVEKLTIFRGTLTPPDLVGKAAPDFKLQTVDGKAYSLAALKGKPVLLDFWATWCGPCRKAMPSVEKVYRDFKDQGLMVLGIDAREGRELVAEFLKRNPLAYPAVLSGESMVLADYQVKGYPTFVLIGADGKIAAYEIGFGGEEVLRGMLEKAGLSARK